MAVTTIPNVTNWSVTPQNGQVGYFTLMNTWLSESTAVIASLQTAINAQNTANSEINALAIQVAGNAIDARNARNEALTAVATLQGGAIDNTTIAPNKAFSNQYVDNNFVKLTGNQTVAGVKTFSSNIVGNITGNAGTATKLATSKTINGVPFDGSDNISVGLNNQSTVLATAFTLNDTHKNRLLVCSGTFNITLPTVDTINSGDLFIINNAGTGTLSLVTNGNNTDLSRLTVLAGEVLILQSDGGSFYRFVSRSKDFASNISVSTGYTYLPNGVIMQWGKSTANIAPGGTLNITFPIAFPNDIFYSNVAIVTVSTNNQLVVPFVVATSTSNLSITNTDVDSSITQIRWFSIGF